MHPFVRSMCILSICPPLVFLLCYYSTKSILPENLFDSCFFSFLVRSLQDKKAIEIHLSIVLEEVFSLTTLNKLLV